MKRTLELATLVCGCLTVVLSCTYDKDLPAPNADGGNVRDGNGMPELEPAWPDATEWSDYLTGSVYEPSGTGRYCSPDEVDDIFCFRAGVLRKLVLADEESCEGLEISDAEHWYDWTCDDAKNEVVFKSTMRPEVGLADVIDAMKREWRANSVTVMRGDEVVAATKSAALWAAPILPLPEASDGVIELDQPDAVYVATGTVEGVVHIAAHGVSLLGVGNVTLGAPESSSPVLFTEERRAFVWLENLTIDADDHPAGADVDLLYGVVRGLEVKRDADAATTPTPDLRIGAFASKLQGLVSINAPGTGIELAGDGYIDTVQRVEAIDPGGDGVWITRNQGVILDVSVNGCGGDGIRLENAAKLTLNHVTVADCDGDGVDTATGTLIVLSDVVATNNEESGVVLRGDDQVLSAVIAANNERDGVRLEGRNALLMHATTTNNIEAGLHVKSGASANEIVNVVSANNETGLWLDGGSAGSLVHNAWLSANETDVHVEGNGNVFSGTLDLGGMDACTIAGAPAEPGLSASPCAIANASTATITFDNPLSTSDDGALIGRLPGRDPKNPAWLDGSVQAYAAIDDWLSFSVRQRHWGRPPSGSAFPDAAARGRCDTESACAIWDWRVTSNPSRIRNPIGEEDDALLDELRSVTHVRKHVWAATGDEACFESDHTAWVETPEPECSTSFLDYGLEPIYDDNNNSICAAGVLCFLNWNRGAFPGSGFGDRHLEFPEWHYPEDLLELSTEWLGPEMPVPLDVPGLGELYVFQFATNGD